MKGRYIMKVTRRVVLEVTEEYEIEDESNLMDINKYASELASSIKTEYKKVRIINAEHIL